MLIAAIDEGAVEQVERRDQAPLLREMLLLEDDVSQLPDAGAYLRGDFASPLAARHENCTADSAMDLLLGTQGWRRFAFYHMDQDVILTSSIDPSVSLMPP